MHKEHSDIAIAGASAAGLGCASVLAEDDNVQQTVLDWGLAAASSWRNQKWLQSGANYTATALALALWQEFPNMVRTAQKFLLQRGAYFVAQSEETLENREHLLQQVGIPYQRVIPKALPTDGLLGTPQCVGGLLAPDWVIDFPALLRDLRTQLAQSANTRLLMGATVKRLLRDGDQVAGVLYEKDGEEVLLTCHHCVVALGAYSVELLQDIGVTNLPIQRWTSHIVELDKEVVQHITVWTDDPGMTLVPYKGRTLIANTRRVPVQDITTAYTTIEKEVEILLYEQLVAAFPHLCWDALQVLAARACVKTERSNDPGARNQHFAVFGEEDHGVAGLTVALPGKATLMFQLGRAVAARIKRP
jgi:glycine/D-amino acid oxidase-like deaminating enzyme